MWWATVKQSAWLVTRVLTFQATIRPKWPLRYNVPQKSAEIAPGPFSRSSLLLPAVRCTKDTIQIRIQRERFSGLSLKKKAKRIQRWRCWEWFFQVSLSRKQNDSEMEMLWSHARRCSSNWPPLSLPLRWKTFSWCAGQCSAVQCSAGICFCPVATPLLSESAMAGEIAVLFQYVMEMDGW
jgi:hypothetical protein